MSKKKYVKPHIIFEDFSLNVGIAGDCEGEPVGNPTRGACAVISSGGIAIFDGNMSVCDFVPGDLGIPEDTYNDFCYHVPTELNTLFNS